MDWGCPYFGPRSCLSRESVTDPKPEPPKTNSFARPAPQSPRSALAAIASAGVRVWILPTQYASSHGAVVRAKATSVRPSSARDRAVGSIARRQSQRCPHPPGDVTGGGLSRAFAAG